MKRNVYLLGITSMLNDMSSEGIYTILPLFLKDPALVGLVGGIFNGFSYMIKPLSGYLSDRIGRSKPFVMFGYAFSALMRTLLSVLPKIYAPVLIALDRIGKGIRDAPRDALLAKVRDRGWAFGLHRALDTTGAVIGTLLATILVYHLSLRTSMLVLALLGFLTLLPLAFVEDEKSKATKDNIINSIEESRKELGYTAIVAALVGLSLISPALFIERAVDVLGKEGIALYVLFNIVYAVSAYILGKESDKIGRKELMGLGIISAIVAILLVSWNSPYTIVLSFPFFGLAFGTVLPVLFARAGDKVKKDVGTGLGLIQFLLGTSMMVSSVLAGTLMSLYGPSSLFVFSLPGLIALLLLPRF